MICLFALIAGGCANTNDDRVKTYGHDGYMGLSNSNPNMPGRHTTINYETDGNMVEQVLRPIAGIRDTQVIFDGTNMHVNLRVNKNLSDAEVQQLLSTAQSVVEFNMPRYDVHVEVRK